MAVPVKLNGNRKLWLAVVVTKDDLKIQLNAINVFLHSVLALAYNQVSKTNLFLRLVHSSNVNLITDNLIIYS